MTLLGDERRARLIAMLGADGAIRLEPAAEALGVSAMTIRRDLEGLEAEGLVRRVRGGAVAPVGPRSFGDRSATRASVKERIARKAAALVPAAGVVALDASTTTGMLVPGFADRELLVATNAIDTARAAERVPGVRALLVGGELDARTGSLVGPLAARSAAQLAYDVFFTSAGAADADGTSEVSLEEGEIKTVFARGAGSTVLLLDASKLGGRAAAHAFDWSQIDVLVTELDPTDARLSTYRDLVDIR